MNSLAPANIVRSHRHWCLLLVSACRATSPNEPAHTLASPHAARPAASAYGQSSQAAPAPPKKSFPRKRVSPGAPPVCVLKGEPWLPGSRDDVLTLFPGGPAFVRVLDSAATIEVPAGDTTHVFVRVSSSGWNWAGHLAAESFSVRTLRTLIHDGFLLPTEFADLDVVRAESAQLWLVARPPGIAQRVLAPQPEPYACDEVHIGPPPLRDAEALLPGDPDARRPVRLRAGEVALSLEPGSEPIARLVVDASSQDVALLQQSGNSSRIAVTTTTTLVFGWVPTSQLLPAAPAEDAYGEGRFGLSGMVGDYVEEQQARGTTYHCPFSLPVVARVADDVMEVGSIDAGTPIRAVSHDGLAILEPPVGMRLAKGARLETESEPLTRCSH